MSVDTEAIERFGVDRDADTTVLDRIVDELDGSEIHAIAVTATRRSTHYAVVAHTTSNSGGDVIDLRTVVVDLDDESVRVTDNGMWIPFDRDAVHAVLKGLARTHTDMAEPDAEGRSPAGLSAVSTPASEVLSTPVEDDDEAPSDGWGDEWGNGEGPPPDAHDLVSRLREADLDGERFSRLDFGSKTPWERRTDPDEGRPVGELLGNFGVETYESGRLVVVDVDYPDEVDRELPETYAVSSASGSDDRAHYYYALPDGVEKYGLYDYYGSWALKPDFGDVWIAGEYVVGPGSRLDDGGTYEVVDDVPIATIKPSELMSIVPRSVDEAEGHDDDVEDDEDGDADADEDGVERESITGSTPDAEDADLVTCSECGRFVRRGAATLTDLGDGPVYVCDEHDEHEGRA